MPVDYRPLFAILLFVLLPICAAALAGRHAFLITTALEALLFSLVVLSVYGRVIPLVYRARVHSEPAAQYELARWYSNNLIARHTRPDVTSSFEWLGAAAAGNYPPAMYALGVMYKYGIFVPSQPGSRTGGGNVHPDPAKGQRLIDASIAAGYVPAVPEDAFYNAVFRRAGG